MAEQTHILEGHVTYAQEIKYKWVTEVGKNTCDKCKALDGKVFDKDNVPQRPHPNCKCRVEEISIVRDDVAEENNYEEELKNLKLDALKLQGDISRMQTELETYFLEFKPIVNMEEYEKYVKTMKEEAKAHSYEEEVMGSHAHEGQKRNYEAEVLAKYEYQEIPRNPQEEVLHKNYTVYGKPSKTYINNYLKSKGYKEDDAEMEKYLSTRTEDPEKLNKYMEESVGREAYRDIPRDYEAEVLARYEHIDYTEAMNKVLNEHAAEFDEAIMNEVLKKAFPEEYADLETPIPDFVPEIEKPAMEVFKELPLESKWRAIKEAFQLQIQMYIDHMPRKIRSGNIPTLRVELEVFSNALHTQKLNVAIFEKSILDALIGHISDNFPLFYDAEGLWDVASHFETRGKKYIEKNGIIINSVNDISDENLKQIIIDKLKSQDMPTDVMGIRLRDDCHLAKEIVKHDSFKNLIKTNKDKLLQDGKIDNSEKLSMELIFPFDLFFAVHKCDVRDVYIDNEKNLRAKIIDTSDFNAGEKDPLVIVGRIIQENNLLKQFFTIIDIKIPANIWKNY